jgi:hypothetical protein
MDTLRPQARRPVIIADIVLDGWAESARRVYRKLRNLQKMRLVVWVDNAGCVWTKGLASNDRFDCPEGQHLATYDQGVPINEIEDELLFHLRTMTNTNQRKAA